TAAASLPGDVADTSEPPLLAACTAAVFAEEGALTDAIEPVLEVVLVDVVAWPVAIEADGAAETVTVALADVSSAGDDAIAPAVARAVVASTVGDAVLRAAVSAEASAGVSADGWTSATVTVGPDAAKIEPNAIVTVARSPLRTNA